MRNSLTIIYTTCRQHCEFQWAVDSLNAQLKEGESIDLLMVCWNLCRTEEGNVQQHGQVKVKFLNPKPTIWQGTHRITKEDWWAKCNALNTGIALCGTEWVAFLDDRCVLTPTWLQSIREAMDKNYAVCGAYEKRSGMKVKDGVIVEPGEVIGRDSREGGGKRSCGPGWWFGCTGALPLEWVLECNGFPEDYADGLSFEDVLFGHLIDGNNHPIIYDPAMKIIEDRTPEFCGKPLRRTDKGVSPNDKSHKVLELFQRRKTSGNSYNLRELRDKMLAGGEWPMPTASHNDWFDQKPIKDMI